MDNKFSRFSFVQLVVCSTSTISPVHTKLKFVSNLALIVFSILLLEHVGRRSSNCGQQSEKHSTDQIITSLYEMKLKELQLDCSGSAGSEIKTPKIIFLNQIPFFFLKNGSGLIWNFSQDLKQSMYCLQKGVYSQKYAFR